MPLPRIYQAVPLHIDQVLYLDHPATRHLIGALRARKGDQLVIFNGEGGEYTAEIRLIHKNKTEVKIRSFVSRELEPPIQIQLAQSIARGEKMDWIVQKAVELGATSVVPLLTEQGNVKLDTQRADKRRQHWQAVAISACEQSGRNRVPQIIQPLSLSAWLPLVSATHRFVLSPHAQGKLPSGPLAPNASIALLIGPEGGLSQQEVAMTERHGFLPLRLGPRILRTETAALAAITALQLHWGDLG